jgi:hypothetical protein
LQYGRGYGSSEDILSPCCTPKQFSGKEKLNKNKITPARLKENFKKQNFIMSHD